MRISRHFISSPARRLLPSRHLLAISPLPPRYWWMNIYRHSTDWIIRQRCRRRILIGVTQCSRSQPACGHMVYFFRDYFPPTGFSRCTALIILIFSSWGVNTWSALRRYIPKWRAGHFSTALQMIEQHALKIMRSSMTFPLFSIECFSCRPTGHLLRGTII